MLSPMNLTIDLRSAAVPHGLDLPVARSRQVCIYWLWKHCLFCRDCLWRERTSIYSWRLPWFAGNALYRLTGDAPSPRRRSPCASLAITLCLTGDHLVDDALLE